MRQQATRRRLRAILYSKFASGLISLEVGQQTVGLWEMRLVHVNMTYSGALQVSLVLLAWHSRGAIAVLLVLDRQEFRIHGVHGHVPSATTVTLDGCTK